MQIPKDGNKSQLSGTMLTWWKSAIFSLTKKVSGTQISLMYSAPTWTNEKYLGFLKLSLLGCENLFLGHKTEKRLRAV